MQGVIEAFVSLLKKSDATVMIDGSPTAIYALYAGNFMLSVDDFEKDTGGFAAEMFPMLLKKKPLTPAQIRKYAAMETEDFAQLLYNLATDNGKTIEDDTKNIVRKCIYPAYVYYSVSRFIEDQGRIFAFVPQNKAMNTLALINTGKFSLDEKTKTGKVKVADAVFELKNFSKTQVSTATLILNDILLDECRKAGTPSITISVRELAKLKGRSETKQAIQKLRAELVDQMEELASIKYTGREKIDGKWKNSGGLEINGGTHIIKDGILYWNYNADLYSQLSELAPMDYPKELWRTDPRTNQYYFGRYIATNWRLNEGKKGRCKITIRTLISKTPNLPTYAEVMKGNRNVSARIIKKTFEDLDALESVYYDVYTADGQKVEDPMAMDYPTFIKAYIMVDYSDYPQHEKRIDSRIRRQKRIADAKEKAQAKAAAKKAVDA